MSYVVGDSPPGFEMLIMAAEHAVAHHIDCAITKRVPTLFPYELYQAMLPVVIGYYLGALDLYGATLDPPMTGNQLWSGMRAAMDTQN